MSSLRLAAWKLGNYDSLAGLLIVAAKAGLPLTPVSIARESSFKLVPILARGDSVILRQSPVAPHVAAKARSGGARVQLLLGRQHLLSRHDLGQAVPGHERHALHTQGC